MESTYEIYAKLKETKAKKRRTVRVMNFLIFFPKVRRQESMVSRLKYMYYTSLVTPAILRSFS